jgi:excisionase family DNA binding protein
MIDIAKREELVSVPQFADVLGVTQACVRRWLLERKIAYVKLGRLVRVPREELERLIAEGFRPAKTRRAQ